MTNTSHLKTQDLYHDNRIKFGVIGQAVEVGMFL